MEARASILFFYTIPIDNRNSFHMLELSACAFLFEKIKRSGGAIAPRTWYNYWQLPTRGDVPYTFNPVKSAVL